MRSRVSSLRWQAASTWWKGTAGGRPGRAGARVAPDVVEPVRRERRVARDRRGEVAGAALAADHRVEQEPHHALHHGGHELVAVAEVHVEGAAGEARAGADGVEARRVEALLGELGHRGAQERLAGLLLRGLPGAGR